MWIVSTLILAQHEIENGDSIWSAQIWFSSAKLETNKNVRNLITLSWAKITKVSLTSQVEILNTCRTIHCYCRLLRITLLIFWRRRAGFITRHSRGLWPNKLVRTPNKRHSPRAGALNCHSTTQQTQERCCLPPRASLAFLVSSRSIR